VRELTGVAQLLLQPHPSRSVRGSGTCFPLEGTPWELTQAAAQAPAIVLQVLIGQTAHSSLVHNDDTGMRVQELRESGSPTAAEIDPKRTGTFTTAQTPPLGPPGAGVYTL